MMPADQIKALRKIRGWNQETMAAQLGVDQATVSRIERGTAEPSGPVKLLLEKLAAEPVPTVQAAE